MIVVRIDSSWGPTTNANVWNAVQCGVSAWNNATDASGNKTGYHLVVDQANQTGVGTPDINVRNQAPSGGGLASTDANINPGSSTRTNNINLAPANGTLGNGSFTASDLCGRVAHEIGHLFGIANTDCNSIMKGANTNGTRDVDTVKPVDVLRVNTHFASTSNCNSTIASEGTVGEQEDTCTPSQAQLEWCDFYLGWWDYDLCACNDFSSPIVVDVLGDGFNLTNTQNGVIFDLNTDTVGERVSWTAVGADDAWLALDQNSNGMIDNGAELFGNYTLQSPPPPGEGRNGFLALAEYDKPINGGNGDGLITQSDSIFASLRLWRDVNHNGNSEPAELSNLQTANLATLELDYKVSKQTDQFGNQFRYRAKVKDSRGGQFGRWAWDVFLRATP